MKKIALLIAIFTALTGFSQQKYYTKTGNILFKAGTSLEDIDGENKSAASVFDTGTGQFEFAVLVKGFEFKRALMQEHFNENYLESHKYPKAVFKGKIMNLERINFGKDGSYPVIVKGILDMHGVKKEIEARGTMKKSGEMLSASSEFSVLLSDYDISIPGLVKDKISKTVTINVSCQYNILK